MRTYRLRLSGFFALLSIFTSGVLSAADVPQPAKDYCCFLIDRSKSIAQNNLAKPVAGAIAEYMGRLPDETCVEMVFFSTTANKPKRWERLDLSARGDILAYFQDQFKPDGMTRLYDTVAEGITRAQKEEGNYRKVRIIVLTDGKDEGPGGKQLSATYTNWTGPEALAKGLKRTNPNSLVTMYTLGFDLPADQKPQSDGPIQTVTVLDPHKDWRIIDQPPKAAFKWSPEPVRVGEQITLIDESEGAPSTWRWSVPGMAMPLTDRSPRVTFATVGKVSVSLTVERDGQKDTVNHSIDVRPLPPIKAAFKWSPEPVRVGEQITLIDESEGAPTFWRWTVPGQTAPLTDRSPKVTFATVGKVTVSLTVEKDGRKDTVNHSIDVLPLPPIKAAFKWSPEPVHVGEQITLVDESEGAPASWRWTVPSQATPLVERSPKVTFATVGKVTVSLTVEKDGRKDTVNRSIDVLPLPPLKAEFKWSPETVYVNDQVMLVDVSEGAPASWRWVVAGQTEPLPERTPTVSFAAVGKATVSLTVEKDGRKDTVNHNIDVRPLPPLTAAFKWSPEPAHVGDLVQLADQSTGGPKKWQWQISGVGTRIDQAPSFTCATTGNVSVALTIKRDDASSTTQRVVVVHPKVVTLRAVFEFSPRKGGHAPLTMSFTDHSVGSVSKWAWDLGDGQFSDVQNPTHTYERPGRYMPRLRITSTLDGQAMDPGDAVITVTAPPPVWPWWVALGIAVLAVATWLGMRSIPPYLTGRIAWESNDARSSIGLDALRTRSLTLCAQHIQGWDAPPAEKYTVFSRPRGGVELRTNNGVQQDLVETPEFKAGSVRLTYHSA